MYTKKNEWKKPLIFEKREDFENWKKWPLGKGYSPCTMYSLGQKIKLRKTTLESHINWSIQKTDEKNN